MFAPDAGEGDRYCGGDGRGPAEEMIEQTGMESFELNIRLCTDPRTDVKVFKHLLKPSKAESTDSLYLKGLVSRLNNGRLDFRREPANQGLVREYGKEYRLLRTNWCLSALVCQTKLLELGFAFSPSHSLPQNA